MSDINNFKQIMKQWITVDDQIREATRSLKVLRNERTHLTESACNIITTNKWESRKIEAADSQITFALKKDYPALTFAFLEKHLAEIIPNADDVKQIVLHLKNKREPKFSPDLKRRHNNRIDGGYETE
jgi:hypothetical protein